MGIFGFTLAARMPVIHATLGVVSDHACLSLFWPPITHSTQHPCDDAVMTTSNDTHALLVSHCFRCCTTFPI